MNGLSERLKLVRDHLGLSQEEMAALVGMKRRGYQDTEQRGTAKSEMIAKLVEAGINANWLLSGDGAMLLGDAVAQEAPQGTRNCADDYQPGDDEFAYIPLYDAQVSAGHGASMENARVLSHLAFRQDWLQEAGLSAGNLSAVQVSGDSMLGVVADGDTVLVDHSRRDVSREGLYVLRLDDHLYVKHLQKTLDGVNIISANKVYSTISVPRDRLNDLEVIGRAVWSASWLD
ncbi:XRE family transcriptional regulator [Spongiibacter sp. UBA1325]|uniref:XRE family transcriptional regulator n=1 Tax=Spongiibacter sp. UBA1325 TaxID=1947543 RepID=UPI00257D6198|nr:S24 family peptidase [Spongiibacter sp. UBA1325]|tara:strand:+ start:252 stop:944 length:693 start_codon:yes stop_codon:yes gene_type:complete